MRAASSKGAADLIALWPREAACPRCPGQGATMMLLNQPAWLIQCKRDGKLPRAERETLIEIAKKTGAVPVLAKTGANGRGVEFKVLTEE